MKFHRNSRHGFRGGAIEGAVDPDRFFSDNTPAKPEHHTQAFCKQVQRTLSTVLSGECSDMLLQDLQVLAVLPAPNAGNLMIVVSPRTMQVTMMDVLERLERVTPLLRARIAQESTRKKTPQLSYQVLGTGVMSLEPQACGDSVGEDRP